MNASWTLLSISHEGCLHLGCPGQDLRGRNLGEWIPVGLPAAPRECRSADSGEAATAKLDSLSVAVRVINRGVFPARLRVSPAGQDRAGTWLVLLRFESVPVKLTRSNDGDPIVPSPAVAALADPRAENWSAASSEHHGIIVDAHPEQTGTAADPGSAPTPLPPPIPVETFDLAPSPAGLPCEPPSSVTAEEAPSADALTETPFMAASGLDLIPVAVPPAAAEEAVAISGVDEMTPPAEHESETNSIGPESLGASLPEAEAHPAPALEALSLRQLRVRNAHLLQANTDLQTRLEASIEAAARAAANAQCELSERGRAQQQVIALTTRLGKLHDEVSQHLANENAARIRQDKLEVRCREQAEALAAAQSQLAQQAAERQALEHRMRASPDRAEALRRQMASREEGHRRAAAESSDLCEQLQGSARANAELRERWQEAIQDRQRLENQLQQVQVQAEDASRRSALEISRLRADVHAESLLRSRTEADFDELRCEATEAAQSHRSEQGLLLQRLRNPAAVLTRNFGRLLDSDLTMEQRETIEAAAGAASLILRYLDDLSVTNTRGGRIGLVETPETSELRCGKSARVSP